VTHEAPLHAMIFAAGRGERMRPLSDVVPKPALRIADRPVICCPIRLAASAGCRRIAVNTWHLADLMTDAVRTCDAHGAAVEFSREEQLMGTAGGLALARDRGLLGDEGPVLVVNGDGLLDLNLEPLIARSTQRGESVTLALLPHPDVHRWSRVVLDAGGLVTEIAPPGSAAATDQPLLYPGVMMVSRGALDRLSARPHGVAEGLWGPALESRTMGGELVTGRWREVGTPADYLAAVLARTGHQPVIDPTAAVHGGASLGAAYIGRRAQVHEGAVVGESVIAEGAVVGRGARVIRSVLLGPVDIGEDELVIEEHRAAPLQSAMAQE
jgi:NDP-sugar pyrophosphorylase family protein